MEKVELDLSYYVTKGDLKSAAGADTSDFVKKTDLANLKPDVDKLDIDKLKKWHIWKLKTTLIELGKLNNVVKNGVVKKTECNQLV